MSCSRSFCTSNPAAAPEKSQLRMTVTAPALSDDRKHLLHRRVRWIVAEKKFADALRKLFDKNNLDNVEINHLAP